MLGWNRSPCGNQLLSCHYSPSLQHRPLQNKKRNETNKQQQNCIINVSFLQIFSRSTSNQCSHTYCKPRAAAGKCFPCRIEWQYAVQCIPRMFDRKSFITCYTSQHIYHIYIGKWGPFVLYRKMQLTPFYVFINRREKKRNRNILSI